MNKNITNTKVLYHAKCNDGSLAAVLYYKYLKHFKFDTKLSQKNLINKDGLLNISSFSIPMDYSTSFDLNDLQGKDVVMLDFSFKEDKFLELLEMLEMGVINSLIILDHHKTFKDILNIPSISDKINYLKQNNGYQLYIEVDMNRSGAGMTYDYIFDQLFKSYPEKTDLIKNIKEFIFNNYPVVKYIQDIDIWTKKYPDSSAFSQGFYQIISKNPNSYLEIINQKFNGFDILFDLIKTNQKELNQSFNFNDEVKECLDVGREILDLQKQKIDRIYKTSKNINIKIDNQVFKLKLFKIDFSDKDIINDLGNKVYSEGDKKTVSAVYFEKDEKIAFSLRSSPLVDSSIIAKYFGGGGHKQACAATFNNILDFNKSINEIQYDIEKKQ